MILVGQRSFERAIAEYVAHYHGERSRQGLRNELLSGALPEREGAVATTERLGGLLKYCHRKAA